MDAKKKLTIQEIRAAFSDDLGKKYGPFVSPAQLGEITGVPRATVYEWIRKGRLDGCFRKRGKHVLLWRDGALFRIFSGPEWKDKKDDVK